MKKNDCCTARFLLVFAILLMPLWAQAQKTAAEKQKEVRQEEKKSESSSGKAKVEIPALSVPESASGKENIIRPVPRYKSIVMPQKPAAENKSHTLSPEEQFEEEASFRNELREAEKLEVVKQPSEEVEALKSTRTTPSISNGRRDRMAVEKQKQIRKVVYRKQRESEEPESSSSADTADSYGKITGTAIQIIYSEGGSLGEYRKGEYWGITIQVLFSGQVKYFDHFYPDTLIQRDEFSLNAAAESALWELFESTQYSNFSNLFRVNTGDDTTAMLKISYRYSPAAFFNTAQINLINGKEGLTEEFFEFVRKLKTILFNARIRGL